MNYLNSFNVQGEPCIMGYNKIVVPYTELPGFFIKIPTILAVVIEALSGDRDPFFSKEEFLQFLGGSFPETTGAYFLVENIEDSVGVASKWTENFLAEKMLELELGAPAKVYTMSCEDVLSVTSMYPQLADDNVSNLVALSTLGVTIIDVEEQVLLTVGLPLSF